MTHNADFDAPTREDLVRFLHNEGDGGVWESLDRNGAEAVADALIESGLTRVIPSAAPHAAPKDNTR